MISRRKVFYPVSDAMREYLAHSGRNSDIPLVYDDLLRFTGSIPYENPAGEETLWLEVMYPPEVMAELRPKLTGIYATLKIGGDLSMTEHLSVERIDFGEFGNSRPFRIRITNLFNGNSDYYYVKHADASRLFGLELEHTLSPNRINYLVNGNTLIEEHIAGVPGDVFIRDYLVDPALNNVRIAKEFVKFGERCFLRLLGDMRTVNYVVDITPDFEEVQYRVRPIDFDQQSYEGNLSVYRAHLFPDNKPVEELVRTHLNDQTILQYRAEEHSQMSRRAKVEWSRLMRLLRVMEKETLSPYEHVVSLREAFVERYGSHAFESCETMGQLTRAHLQIVLEGKHS
ncbi:hypothetical protein N9A78_03015 [Akkermansiaceae bacterium]|jgi:hypothetical protein|nr:hypothetical protein [Akkermansiaceae bacterium]MDA7930686.1 hypothetical protein [Akkermansiaceae bacterium]MDB4400766.1 hypothetical protein [Akkermansiaceae bacterium]MDB4404413.1 hypothetical protein [Akkermansiaceae bacterium]|tara:strand:+ start:1949 stop:2974 length:1026 start_codon:yes stop_codon:yes gene_type:complete